MNKACPSCSERSIPVSDVLLSDANCSKCGSRVGFHWAMSLAFAAVIIPITVISTLMVLAQMDVYAALLWVPFPIGAISYIKARFCPLVVRADDWKRDNASDV